MDRRFVIGLDLGTGSCKVCLTDAAGRPAGDAAAGYDTSIPHPGWAEQDPAAWLRAIAAAVPELLRRARVPSDKIAGLALTGAAHIGVLVDAAGDPVRPAILWNDQRTTAEVADLERAAGDEILATSCQRVSTGWTLPHLLWVQRHDRPAWERTRAVLLSKDFLLKWLTGRAATDPATAVSSQLYDVRGNAWSARLCALAGIAPDMLPPVVPSTTPVGGLTVAAATAIGLRPGTPVVAGTLDSATELLAAGVCAPGAGMIRLATAGGIQRVVAGPTPDRRRITYPHALAPFWYCQAGTNTCAAAVRWGKRLCAGVADALSYETWDAEAESAPAGSAGLLFYPYLAGERAPHWNPLLRGGFIGLSLTHGRNHLARAIYEGTAFSIRQAMTALAGGAAAPAEEPLLAVAGGGTRSDLWVSILANVLGRPLRVVRGADSAHGAALIALAGLGLAGGDLRALAGARSGVGQVVRPEPGLQALYRRRFTAYVDAQEHLLPVLESPIRRQASRRKGGASETPA